MSVTKNYRQLVKLDEAHYLDKNAIESVTFSALSGSLVANVVMESGTRHVYTKHNAERIANWLEHLAVPIGEHHPQLAVEHQQPAEPEPIVRGVDQFNAVWQQVLATYFAHRREIQRIEAAVGPQPPVAAITELEDFFNAFDAYMRS